MEKINISIAGFKEEKNATVKERGRERGKEMRAERRKNVMKREYMREK